MSAPLTWHALLAHPDNGGARIVAGPADAIWTGTCVESDEASLPATGDDHLAIVTSAIAPTPWQQDALLRRVRERGFTALAVPGAHTLNSGSLALAARIGLTLIDTERPLLLAKACWQLMEGRDALALHYVRKVANAAEHRSTEMIDMLRNLAANLGHGVALIDAEGVLVQAGGELPSSLHAAIDRAARVDLARAEDSAAASVRVDSPNRTGLRLALFDVGLDERQLGALGIAAEVAMPATAARLLIDEVHEITSASVSSGVLRDFMDLRGASDLEVERRMLDLGWRTTGYHLAFRIVGRSKVDPLALLRFINTELHGLRVDAHATTSGRGVSGWLSFTDPPSGTQVQQFVRDLRDIHKAAQRHFPVATGVGSLASGSAGLTTSLSEATDAAKVASARAANGWFVRVDGLGLEQLLLTWTGNDTFVPAAQSLLAPLRQGNGELLTTLSAYLDHESAVSPTAEALGLHRNTVATRVQRAQELLGVDLSDPEVRLALHLACRAVR